MKTNDYRSYSHILSSFEVKSCETVRPEQDHVFAPKTSVVLVQCSTELCCEFVIYP